MSLIEISNRTLPYPLLSFSGKLLNYISVHYHLYDSFLNLMRSFQVEMGFRERLVREKTNIVIEGFARSGNTFALCAFLFAQKKKIAVAHHIHTPIQIIKGVKLGIPTVVLIRDPKETMLSYLVRGGPYIIPEIALQKYIHYYESIKPYLDDVVIGEFKEVTTDFNSIIKKINKKFGTNYAGFVHSEKNIEKIFSTITQLNKRYDQGRMNRIPRPSVTKELLKMRLKPKLNNLKTQKLFKRAKIVYNEICIQT
ncbi:MAG: hypothetical protein ACFFB5_00645 [Promethearchaeota archaeon]